jgi:hypothetical protein
MRYSTLFLISGLCCFTAGCQRPYSIALQPTVEEASTAPSQIQVGDPATASQFIKGVYPLEDNRYRWAAPQFSVSLGTPPSAMEKGAWLTLAFDLPEVVAKALKNITITAKIGNATLAPETFDSAGPHEYRREVPASAFTQDVTRVDFSVDKSLQPANDARTLTFLLTAVKLEWK